MGTAVGRPVPGRGWALSPEERWPQSTGLPAWQAVGLCFRAALSLMHLGCDKPEQDVGGY